MRIGRNVVFNLIGFLCPAVVLFVSYPPFLHALGAERFGVLTLAMSLAAGLSFLDFGLTAASLRFVVSDLHRREFNAAARVITTSLAFFTGLGLLISFTLFVLSPSVAGWMKVTPAQMDDAVVIFRLTAMQIACSLFLGTLSGLFKSLDRFDLSALTVSVLAVLMYGVPAFQVARLGVSLPMAIATTVVSLFVLCLVGVVVLVKVAGSRGITLRGGGPNVATCRRIFQFGATLTVHMIIGMLFTHGQRILVGFMFGPVPLAAYQLSLTLVGKVHAAINAAAEVALPVASSEQTDLIKRSYGRGMLVLGAMSFVPLAAIAVGRHWIIQLWLGANSPPLAPVLLPAMCLAYFFVALSALPYHILNGLGRPGVNVAFAIFNIVVYVVALVGFELFHARNVLNVAIAFAISNVCCGVGYQIYCHRLVAALVPRSREPTPVAVPSA
jgi:O-antigen/teichoic acid export membrane protein